MPSDLAKKKAAKKKEAAKARQRTKKTDELEDEEPETELNGAQSNGGRTLLWLNVLGKSGGSPGLCHWSVLTKLLRVNKSCNYSK